MARSNSAEYCTSGDYSVPNGRQRAEMNNALPKSAGTYLQQQDNLPRDMGLNPNSARGRNSNAYANANANANKYASESSSLDTYDSYGPKASGNTASRGLGARFRGTNGGKGGAYDDGLIREEGRPTGFQPVGRSGEVKRLPVKKIQEEYDDYGESQPGYQSNNSKGPSAVDRNKFAVSEMNMMSSAEEEGQIDTGEQIEVLTQTNSVFVLIFLCSVQVVYFIAVFSLQ